MEERDYRKLFWKIVCTTLAFSLLPLFTLGLSIYFQFSDSLHAKVMDSLRSRTENRRNTIDLFLEERVSQLNTLAYTHTLKQLQDAEYLNGVFTLMQMRAKSYVDIGVIGPDGKYVAYVGPYQLQGVDYSNEGWFHEVMHQGVYISDVFTGFRKFPHFIIAVLRREGGQNWILRATIGTEIFDSMVRAAQLGQNGDAFVINRDYVLQTSPRFGGILLQKIEFPNVSQFFGVYIDETDLNGSSAIVGMAWLKNKDWLLVIKEDPHEDMMPVLRARVTMIVLVCGGMLVIILGTILTARKMVGHLVTSEREKTVLDASLLQSSKMAALGKLAAGIAHEVNNPLAVIKEKTGWMRDLLSEEDISKSANFAEFDDAVRKIDYHVDRAGKVTHRLLGFARRMEPIHERVDVNGVLEETIEFMKNEAHYRSIEIETELAPDLPMTMSDSSQLQQVILNLLNNAIDAIGKSGKIRVVTGVSVKQKELSISVTDNGPGIPGDTIKKIFDPFFTTKQVGKGTGLGLSISYSIVEKLGGRMMVSSEEGHGATFTIYLPVVQGGE